MPATVRGRAAASSCSTTRADRCRCRRLDRGLPMGSPMHLDVSWDGRRILFAYCETDPERHRVAGQHGSVLPPLRDVGRRLGPAATDRRPGRRFRAALSAQRQDPLHLHAARRIPPLRTRAVPRVHDGDRPRRRVERSRHLLPRDARVGPGRAQRRADHLHPLGLRRSPRRPLPAVVVRAARRQRRAQPSTATTRSTRSASGKHGRSPAPIA